MAPMARLRPLKLILGVELNDIVVTDVITLDRETLAGLNQEELHQTFQDQLQIHADKHIKTWYEIREEE
jgi:hypothetical protein